MGDSRLYWLHALTPVHAGIGTGSGFIDLPIMREKITNWPLIPGSSVKGVQKEKYRKSADRDARLFDIAFGTADPDGSVENTNAGALVYSDARIVCLATRSYYGTFAYVTSPLVLARLKRDDEGGGRSLAALPEVIVSAGQAALPNGSVLASPDGKVCLGELLLDQLLSEDAWKWADAIAKVLFPAPPWNELFMERFAVVPQDVFNFLCETGCEVSARIKLEEDRKKVKKGHFWYEESLPAESILAGIVWCDQVYQKKPEYVPSDILGFFCADEQFVQIGGKATVGKGRMRCCFSSAEAEVVEAARA